MAAGAFGLIAVRDRSGTAAGDGAISRVGLRGDHIRELRPSGASSPNYRDRDPKVIMDSFRFAVIRYLIRFGPLPWVRID